MAVCVDPGRITLEQIIAAVDDEAPPEAVAHLRACAACAATAAEYARIQRALVARLAHFDCPTPLTLGEYALHLLAAERGIAIHAALAAFMRAYPDELPDNADAELLRMGEQAFGAALTRPAVRAFWWPRYARIARWFVAMERARRAVGAKPLVCEGEGTLALSLPGSGNFTLTARVDRIDELADGTLAIIDYKTGVLPKPSEVALGFAPQLPLEAAIARKGGFRDVPAAMTTQLRYWRLSGGRDAGEEVAVDGKRLAKDAPPLDPVVLTDEAEAGLTRLAVRYRDPATPYPARPLFEYAPRYSDYGHLARVKEWATLEDEA